MARGYRGTTFIDPKDGYTGVNFPYVAFELLSANHAVFSSLWGYSNAGRLNMQIGGQADLASGQHCTGAFFSGLGVLPAAGRLLDPSDDCAGAAPVAVASFRYAQSRFGDVTRAVGQRILVNNIPFTIAGVAAPTFFGINPATRTDIFLPMHTSLLLETMYSGDPNAKGIDRNRYWIEMMGRLRPSYAQQPDV